MAAFDLVRLARPLVSLLWGFLDILDILGLRFIYRLFLDLGTQSSAEAPRENQFTGSMAGRSSLTSWIIFMGLWYQYWSSSMERLKTKWVCLDGKLFLINTPQEFSSPPLKIIIQDKSEGWSKVSKGMSKSKSDVLSGLSGTLTSPFVELVYFLIFWRHRQHVFFCLSHYYRHFS